jgi:aryl-alcohol dehydrogenase-like predicted oxidoreductase
MAARGKELALRLGSLAAEWDVPTAHLAFAYALDQPHLATVLFGATSAEQVRTNVAAVATHQLLDASQRAAIAALA